MKDLSLRDILRYGVAGGVLLLTIGTVEGFAVVKTVRPDSLGGATALFGIALVLGAVVYSFHRALLFPFILRTQLSCSKTARELLGCPVPIWTVVSHAEMRFDQLRLADSDTTGKTFPEWADQVHLLYTSAEAIALGLICELIAPNGLTLTFAGTPHMIADALIACSVLLFTAGAISHRRLLATMCEMLLQKKNRTAYETA